MLRRIQISVALVAVAVFTAAAHDRLPHEPKLQRGDDYVPQPRFAKAVAMGYDAVLADYYWVQAVLVVGESLRPQLESTQLGRFVDVVTTLNPWVDHPYRFAAIWLTETLDDVHLANELLERSFPYHPDEWRNRFYLGFNRFYFLDDRAGAAEILQEASRLPGSPRYLPRLVARLRSEGGDLAAAGMFLEELARNAEDDAARAEYQSALDEVQIEWRARQLDAARENYKKLHGRDIEFVEQLAMGNQAVLPRLPDPEPSSVPAPLRRGSTWVIDEESGRIVSTYYGDRYEVHYDASERMRQNVLDRTAERRSAEADVPDDENDEAGGKQNGGG